MVSKGVSVLVGAFFLLIVGVWFFAFSGEAPPKYDHHTQVIDTREPKHPIVAHPPLAQPSCVETEKTMLATAANLLNSRVYQITDKVGDKEAETLFRGMGHIGQAMPEFHYYFSATKNRTWVKTVCEVGFNAGHSALAFLMGNPKIRYVTFDLLFVRWTKGMIEFMQGAFPGQIVHIPGPSMESVPGWDPKKDFADFNGCDLISADGKHSDPEAYM